MTGTGTKVGRPRNPPAPSKTEPYERPEYAARLQAILDALEIHDLPKEARAYLQKTIRRCDLVRSINPTLAPEGGGTDHRLAAYGVRELERPRCVDGADS